MCIRDRDKLREQGAELWRWINDGAHIYVCGDANRMAKDVEQTLLEVIAEYGAMDAEAADEFLSAVSYTHLDVYKRQPLDLAGGQPASDQTTF